MSKSIQDRLRKLEYEYKCLCNTPSGQGPQGPEGPQGIQGPPGFGIDFQGQLADPSLLPQPSTQGFAYLIGNDFWIYDGSGNWVNAGPIQGPQGIPGTQGIQGVPGDPGATGPQGQGFTYQGNWDNGTTYYPYDVVTYLGSTYITPNTNSGSVPSYDNSNFDWYLFTSIGAQGPPGPSGGGGGGSACPDHFKLAAASGKFTTATLNSPDIDEMFSGNEDLGWSFGNYEALALTDGFGNLVLTKFPLVNSGIPLPIDLNKGDIVRLSGVLYIDTTNAIVKPLNPNFYITLSFFNCSDINPQGVVPGPKPVGKEGIRLYTVIPVATYPVDGSSKVCFSESVSLSEILPANETFFYVGLGFGNDVGNSYDIKFSYTLDASQVCIGTGKNLLISNCCDPVYTEVIIDNGIEVGKSFSDADGNCWTVVEETIDPVTGLRTIDTQYFDCLTCINNNPCPANFAIKSCCGQGDEIFSAALPGVNVGDTFVDSNGFCWGVIDNTSLPITNVVEVGTVYPATSCDDEACTTVNPCPKPVLLESCCGALSGFSSLEILQDTLPTLNYDDVFVDQFGMCWYIKQWDYAFPNLAFIIPVTQYSGGIDDCKDCTIVNECPKDFYYTIQNCCTEEIEVVVMQAIYNSGESLALQLNTGFGCYEVLAWSDTGTPTATLINVEAALKNCNECSKFIQERFGAEYCPGVVQCCTTYTTIKGSENPGIITGYTCDGEWIVAYNVSVNTEICMAFVLKLEGLEKSGICCGFDVFNPSLTQDIDIAFETCNGDANNIKLPGNTLLSDVIGTCVSCARVLKPGQEFEYRDCV